jgi:hypothetical protein
LLRSDATVFIKSKTKLEQETKTLFVHSGSKPRSLKRLHAHACYLDTLQLIVNHPLALLIVDNPDLEIFEWFDLLQINIVIIGNIFLDLVNSSASSGHFDAISFSIHISLFRTLSLVFHSD